MERIIMINMIRLILKTLEKNFKENNLKYGIKWERTNNIVVKQSIDYQMSILNHIKIKIR